DGTRLARLREQLLVMVDFERLAARAVLGSLTPREAAALRDALGGLPALLAELDGSPSGLLAAMAQVDPLADLRGRLAAGLAESPAARPEDGAVIAEGIDAELDEVRSLAHDSKRHILAIEERERARTGIASLKIRYNRVFGYSIEISRAQAAKVPDDYQRRQTLAQAERYVTPELQGLEERIERAEQRQREIEIALYAELRGAVA